MIGVAQVTLGIESTFVVLLRGRCTLNDDNFASLKAQHRTDGLLIIR